MGTLDQHALTWTTLLGRWVEFAQASLAIPADADGERWRASVSAVINLQAVTCALGELGDLPVHDRPLARDRAEIILRESAATIHKAWLGEQMPDSLIDMICDAHTALRMSIYVGTIELRYSGTEPMVMPDATEAIESALAASTAPEQVSLAIMQPGTIVMPGEPVAWTTGPISFDLESLVSVEVEQPRQIYRQMNDAGRITRDVLAPLETNLLPGLPLLLPLVAQGERIGTFTVDPHIWLQQQRDAMDAAMIPVENL